jgi:hypothetical protein
LAGLFLTLAATAPVRAQSQATQTAAQRQGPLSLQDALDAPRVREQFMIVLRQYPPSLGRVLKLDPSLMSNEAYLAPYPALIAYLTQHPEIKRSPEFFLERIDVYNSNYYRSPGQQMWNDLYEGLGVVVIMAIILGALGWIVRTIIDSRRWHRLSKTQTEVHNKLLDRFTANDELLAYVQSPAGKKFLEAAPISVDGGARALSAPFGRILWSVQAGLVAVAAGVGLIFTSGRVDPEAQQPLFTMGVFALSIGVGFVASAVVSYALSRRLGLFEAVTSLRREQTGL